MKSVFRVVYIIIIMVAIVFVTAIQSQQNVLDRNIKRNEELKQLSAQADTELERLMKEKESIGTQAYIELKARELLGYVKGDEIVFIKD